MFYIYIFSLYYLKQKKIFHQSTNFIDFFNPCNKLNLFIFIFILNLK